MNLKLQILPLIIALQATALASATVQDPDSETTKPATSNLRRGLSGGCGNDEKCFERHSGRYQSYRDGFCDDHNLCGGHESYLQSCECRSKFSQRPTKNYIFEQVSDISNVNAYYPYELGYYDITNFVDGPGTQTFAIHNRTDQPPFDASNHLADYSFSLQDESMGGSFALAADVPRISAFGGTLFTNTRFGFRVLQDATYVASVISEGGVYNSNGFRIRIRDRDYHPDQSGSQYVFSEKFVESGSLTLQLEPGHNYLLDIFGYLTGEPGTTALEWKLELE